MLDALAEGSMDAVRTKHRKKGKKQGESRDGWVIVDYGDVVVHVLHKEERETYAIEKFWNHAFKIPEEKWKKASEKYSEYIDK